MAKSKKTTKKKSAPVEKTVEVVDQGSAQPINPLEYHHHHDHIVSHRDVDTIVRQYVLNHLERHAGCQINECQAMVECCLREDFGCCKESLGCVLDSLEWQLPVLHALKGGSSV